MQKTCLKNIKWTFVPDVVPQDERAFPTEPVARLKQIVAWQADELNICLKVIKI